MLAHLQPATVRHAFIRKPGSNKERIRSRCKAYQFLEEMKGLMSARSSTNEHRGSVKPEGLHLTKPLHVSWIVP